jgi:flagellar biosynthesis protein FlhB
MSEESFQEKTEPATDKKRDENRRKGKVVKSAEMNSALILVLGLLVLYFSGAAIVVNLSTVLREAFTSAANIRITSTVAHHMVMKGLSNFMQIMAPVVIGLMVIGLASSYAQVGFMFSLESLQPSWGKLNPLNGMKKLLLSRRSMVELLKNLFKISIIGFIAYFALDGMMASSVTLIDSSAEDILKFMGKTSLGVGMKTGLAFLVLAVFDYLYQRFEYEKEMRMTKQEVKEEYKSQEGDPQIKSRIKTIQRQIAYKRMMQDVPKADVVVTNPTHLAIALKYEPAKMTAPKVVAKGADLIALRIREIASSHAVPIIEDKPLAQTLYKTVDIGDEIPEKLFNAVAQVLAYIYRLKNMKPSINMN